MKKVETLVVEIFLFAFSFGNRKREKKKKIYKKRKEIAIKSKHNIKTAGKQRKK